MSAATAMRVKTERLTSNPQSAPQLTATEIFAGTIVMLNSSGLVRPGATATGCIGAGVAKTRGGLPSWDNSTGASSAITVEYEEGVFGPFDNSGTSIALGDEGKPCYIVDDQTVHLTDGSGTRSPGGRIHSVTSAGVFIEISAKLSREIAESQIVSTGVTLTQTFATAEATHGARTAVAVTDNSGGSTADTTLAVVTAPTAIGATLTDNTGGSGTHDDTLADGLNSSAPDALTATALGDLVATQNTGWGANTEAGFDSISTKFDALLVDVTALRATVATMQLDAVIQNQNDSDLAQKVIELVTAQAEDRAAIVALTNAVAKLAVLANANRVDSVDTASFLNSAVDAMQTADIVD
jgi:hypothetical protein